MPLLLQLERRPGPLRPQILAALAANGRPLRWAITAAAADNPAGAPPEGAAVTRLQIEAVVLA
jgi:hypothetical protein